MVVLAVARGDPHRVVLGVRFVPHDSRLHYVSAPSEFGLNGVAHPPLATSKMPCPTRRHG